ncbi:MAG: hypothetical protein ACRC2B_14275 [Rubrivivax sp.]
MIPLGTGGHACNSSRGQSLRKHRGIMGKTAKTIVEKTRKTLAGPSAATAVKALGKPTPKSALKRPAAPGVKADRTDRPTARAAPATSSTAAEPSLRFYHSRSLREKTHAVLAALESAPEHPRHGDALADLVTELIDAGMDYYFMRALRQAQVGFVAEQSARIGMSGAIKLVSSVSRKFIVRMDRTQLMVVARHIRELS